MTSNIWECNKIATVGLPFCHVIALHNQYTQQFPAFLINDRWRIEPIKKAVPIIEINMVPITDFIDE